MKHAKAVPGPKDPRRTERGSTSTEYAMLVGFIAFAIVAGVTIFGAALNNDYFVLASQLASMLK